MVIRLGNQPRTQAFYSCGELLGNLRSTLVQPRTICVWVDRFADPENIVDWGFSSCTISDCGFTLFFLTHYVEIWQIRKPWNFVDCVDFRSVDCVDFGRVDCGL